ncbi:MAG: glutamate--cysteine ligase [Myxococcota bacterium]
MGIEIDRDQFEPEDYRRFGDRLGRCLAVLESLLARPGFGEGPTTLGAELEVSLIDARARPLPLNEEVLRRTLDPRMTYELDRFNLECNLRHTALVDRPFDHLRRELESARDELSRAASRLGGRIVMIGILPTLAERDLSPAAMTDSARFRALSRALRERRQGPFLLDITGEDRLHLACDDVTFEGAGTSLQVHLRVDPGCFDDAFNAAQLATAPVLAAAGNSPVLLSHRLWEETRVALFKQAVDARDELERERREARVSFGTRWIRDGAIGLLREAVEVFPPLLPQLAEEDPDARIAQGGIPRLEELRLHQGTVWRWNRPVYDPHDGGHLRIELRALPAGPGIEDMLANVAFLIGTTLGLAPHMPRVTREFAFEDAHRNFYRAAQQGLAAELRWPSCLGGGERPLPARELLPTLRETALAGLTGAGVDEAEAAPLVDTFLARARSGRTGAVWQRETLARLETDGLSRDEALARMLERYRAHSDGGTPVSEWPIP